MCWCVCVGVCVCGGGVIVICRINGYKKINIAQLILDNSGSDLRNLIGQLQVSKRGRNLERDSVPVGGGGDSKCPGHLESPF